MADNGEWETPTEEAMDPQQAASKNHPTSKECLDKIPRIMIDPQSAILHEASIDVQVLDLDCNHQNIASQAMEAETKYKLDATIAEFLPHPPFEISGVLELCRPIHGTLPLTTTTTSWTDTRIHYQSAPNKIVYMERGGGVTFVQKSQNAKRLGAQAVICGNNVPIWPYIMKDSKNQALQDDIPIVMLKRSDGQLLKNLLTKSNNVVQVKIHAKKTSNSCIICTEGFQIGRKVMRLPLCSHVFHEECALSWLTKHNTCPFCRRELPAEDKKYESERRRMGRSHAGARDDDGSLAEDQWEGIFG